MAEAAGEIQFRTILVWHSQGRRKGDPKHKCCGKIQMASVGKIQKPIRGTIAQVCTLRDKTQFLLRDTLQLPPPN